MQSTVGSESRPAAVKRESAQSDQTQQTGTSGSGSSLNQNHLAPGTRIPNTVGANLTERSALLNPVARSDSPPPSHDKLDKLYDERC